MNMEIPLGTTAIEIGNFRIEKDEKDKYFVRTAVGRSNFIDARGNISWDKYLPLDTLQDALDLVQKITDYYTAPLPEEDIEEWYKGIIWDLKDDDDYDSHKADNDDYEHLKNLLLAKDWKEASDFLRHLDTFIRDGISNRIMHEIEKNLTDK